MAETDLQIIDQKDIRSKIYLIRDMQIMLDFDLATLYNVSTRVINQYVKRNSNRFPDEFCFKLTTSEYEILRSQFVISSLYGGRRYFPYAFTEQGVAMLSAVLKSDVAVYMSIKIINAFVLMRRTIAANTQLFARLDNVE